MLELFLCSLFTVLPDYLYRHYVQGMRLGKEITVYSVWYQLRWGITLCLILTLALITTVLYFHPFSTNVRSFYRSVALITEISGTVTAVHVKNGERVKAGDLLYQIDDSSQQAAVDKAQREIEEIDAQIQLAKLTLESAIANIDISRAAVQVIGDEYKRNKALLDKKKGFIAIGKVEAMKNDLKVKQAAVIAARKAMELAKARIEISLPASRATAVTVLKEAQAELEKTRMRAGEDGTMEQFELQVGDYITPILRPGGVLVPDSYDGHRFVVGFDQISSGVVKPGMAAEMACIGKPFTVIPMVITEVQNVIPFAQVRPSDFLIDPQEYKKPGMVTAFMEPLYKGNAKGLLPGSACIATAYSHLSENPDGPSTSWFRHRSHAFVNDLVWLHGFLLRIRVVLMPVQKLVLNGESE